MAKKHSTKRKAAQRQLHQLRKQNVNYFAVPNPLWKRIKPLLPKQARRKGPGRPPISNRLVLNGIWYVLWTGCQWKALAREQFGVSSSAAHDRFQLWRAMGIFDDIMAEMVHFYDKRCKIRWKWQAADGKNCPAPLGGEETGRNPTDRGKSGSKIHLLVDRRGAPLAVYVSAANRHDKCSLQDLVFSMVFRAIQELLGNAARHGQGTQVKVSLDLGDDRIRVSVDDNGKGFDSEAVQQGTSLGLKLIRERAEMLGGNFEIDSAPGKGTRVSFVVSARS